ncbi:MAG: Clp1/GlmU family protein [Candidatus Bathyarchaeia archaeon]|nr:Clp1/GlmU family protein [Candidatus Bathyarchaeia archaeon]
MNRTVEEGKTILVDGPASVTVVSGVVEVFDSLVESKGKVVIREGKRLPFTAKETATLEISLGENASIEEVDESTIPPSWTEAYEQLLNFQNKPVVAMVIGTVDSGKTSFCTYLTNKLLHEKQKVAILDGDLGQSDIGPPCTVAYTYITKSVTDLFNLEAKNAFFIGVTSPSTAINKVIEGLTSLKKEILDTDPDFIVINTDGWVEGEDAVNYKVQLAKELNSEIIFCIQQKDELTPLLNSLEGFKKIVVESPSAIKQRSREKRRSLRELGYIKYLKNAKVQSLPIGWLKIEANEFLGLSTHHGDMKQARKVYDFLGMKPLHFAELKDRVYMVIGRSCWINDEKIKKLEEILGKKIVVIRKGEEEGLLVALYNNDRKFLGIGVLREIDYSRKTLKIFTPVSEGISIVALGRVKLDKNLKETPAFAEEA